MSRLNPRERRLVAAALLVAAAALGWLLLLQPLIGGFGDRAVQRAELADRYARDVHATAQLAALRRAADRQRADAGRFVLTAANPGDTLRDRITGAVAASGGTLRSIEDVAAEPATVRVRADAQLTGEQLTATLAALDRDVPLLTVESLTVAADEAFKTNRPGAMDIRFEITARLAAPQPR